MFATAAAAWHPFVPTARRCIQPSAGVNRSARSRIWSKTGRTMQPWKTLWPRWMHRTATAPCTLRRKMGTCHWQSISWSRKQIQVLRTSMVRRRFIWVWPCWLLEDVFLLFLDVQPSNLGGVTWFTMIHGVLMFSNLNISQNGMINDIFFAPPKIILYQENQMIGAAVCHLTFTHFDWASQTFFKVKAVENRTG